MEVEAVELAAAILDAEVQPHDDAGDQEPGPEGPGDEQQRDADTEQSAEEDRVGHEVMRQLAGRLEERSSVLLAVGPAVQRVEDDARQDADQSRERDPAAGVHPAASRHVDPALCRGEGRRGEHERVPVEERPALGLGVEHLAELALLDSDTQGRKGDGRRQQDDQGGGQGIAGTDIRREQVEHQESPKSHHDVKHPLLGVRMIQECHGGLRSYE